MRFYDRHISTFVLFHATACSLLLPCMLKSVPLHVGVEDVIQSSQYYDRLFVLRAIRR